MLILTWVHRYFRRYWLELGGSLLQSPCMPAHYSRFRLHLNIACLRVGNAWQLFTTYLHRHIRHALSKWALSCRTSPWRHSSRKEATHRPHANTKCSNASESTTGRVTSYTHFNWFFRLMKQLRSNQALYRDTMPLNIGMCVYVRKDFLDLQQLDRWPNGRVLKLQITSQD